MRILGAAEGRQFLKSALGLHLSSVAFEPVRLAEVEHKKNAMSLTSTPIPLTVNPPEVSLVSDHRGFDTAHVL
jgi:hypothetical protein